MFHFPSAAPTSHNGIGAPGVLFTQFAVASLLLLSIANVSQHTVEHMSTSVPSAMASLRSRRVSADVQIAPDATLEHGHADQLDSKHASLDPDSKQQTESFSSVPLLKYEDGQPYLKPEGLALLEQLDPELPVVVIAFIGDGRSGKSYIANKFLQRLTKSSRDYFKSSDTYEPVTNGIDVVSVEHRKQNVVVFDCEGGNNAFAETRHMVSVLSILSATKVVFVTPNTVTNADLETLHQLKKPFDKSFEHGKRSTHKPDFLFVVNPSVLNIPKEQFTALWNNHPGIGSLFARSDFAVNRPGMYSDDIQAALESAQPWVVEGRAITGRHLADIIEDSFGRVRDNEIIHYDNIEDKMVRRFLAEIWAKILSTVTYPQKWGDIQLDWSQEALEKYNKNVWIKAQLAKRNEIVKEDMRRFEEACKAIAADVADRHKRLGDEVVDADVEISREVSERKRKGVRGFLARWFKRFRVYDEKVQQRTVETHLDGTWVYSDWTDVSSDSARATATA